MGDCSTKTLLNVSFRGFRRGLTHCTVSSRSTCRVRLSHVGFGHLFSVKYPMSAFGRLPKVCLPRKRLPSRIEMYGWLRPAVLRVQLLIQISFHGLGRSESYTSLALRVGAQSAPKKNNPFRGHLFTSRHDTAVPRFRRPGILSPPFSVCFM